jgi:hypothetical protein
MAWSQEKAAAELGVSWRAYKYLEAGRTTYGARPEVPRTVELACAALRCREAKQP